MSATPDFATIQEKIIESNEFDQIVFEYSDLVRPPSVPPDIDYQEATDASSIGKMASPKPYPDSVASAISSSRFRVFFSALTDLGYLYCVVDNKIFLWSILDSGHPCVLEQPGDCITCVSTLEPDSRFFTKTITSLLVLCTPNSVSVIPYSNGVFFVEDILSTPTTFSVTASAGAHGILFLGTQFGEVYSLKFEESGQLKPSIILSDLSSNPISHFFARVFQSISPVIDMAYDEVGHYLAVVTSTITFYKYSDSSLSYIADNPPKEGEKFVSVSPIPSSDSAFARFVIFNEKSDRLFFAVCLTPLPMVKEVYLKCIRSAPSFLASFPLIYGSFSLGFSILIYRGFMTVFHATHRAHEPPANLFESFARFSLPSVGLGFCYQNHPFRQNRIFSFNHEMLWQHFVDPPSIIVFSPLGSQYLSLTRPVDWFIWMIEASHGGYNENLRKWMTDNCINAEGCAVAIMAAGLLPTIKRRWPLFILANVEKSYSKRLYIDSNYFSIVCMGFVVRLSRMIAPLWSSTLFELRKRKRGQDDKYVVAKVFSEFYDGFSEDLSTIKDLAKEYLSVRHATAEGTALCLHDGIEKEKTFLNSFCEYVDFIIALVKLFKILRGEKSLFVDTCFRRLDLSYQQRLSITTFGGSTSKPTVLEALRELSNKVCLDEDGEPRQIKYDCPYFFSAPIIEIQSAVSQISNANAAAFQKVYRLLSIKIDSPVDFAAVLTKFKENRLFNELIELATKKANSLDPQLKAIRWFKSGRSSDDQAGRGFFDLRYNIYKILFDIPIGLVTSIGDELFQVCFYDYMVRSGRKTELAALSTPFVLSYIKSELKDIAYLYYFNHSQVREAVSSLIDLSESSDAYTTSQRIEWLEIAMKYSNGKNFDIKRKLALLMIQADTSKLLGSDLGCLVPQKLFDLCCSNGFWDLAIRITFHMPINSTALSALWQNFLVERLYSEAPTVAQKMIVNVCDGIPPYSASITFGVLFPILENFRMNRSFPKEWVVSTMAMIGIQPAEIANGYLSAIEKHNLSRDVSLDFMASAAKVNSQYKLGLESRVESAKRMIAERFPGVSGMIERLL